MVGVLTPVLALRQRGSVWGAALALLFVVGIGAAIVAGASFIWAGSQGYTEIDHHERLTPSPERGSRGAAAPYEIEILSSVLAGPKGALSGTVTVVAVSGGIGRNLVVGTPVPGAPRAVVDVRSRRTTLYDAAGGIISRHRSFGLEEAEALYAASGLSTEDEFYRVGIQDLVGRIEAAMTTSANVGWGAMPRMNAAPGQLVASGSGGSSSATVPLHCFGLKGTAALAVLTIISASAVYVLALIWLARRRRALRIRLMA